MYMINRSTVVGWDRVTSTRTEGVLRRRGVTVSVWRGAAAFFSVKCAILTALYNGVRCAVCLGPRRACSLGSSLQR